MLKLLHTNQVDFYVLPSSHSEARLGLFSKLMCKAHEQSLKSIIISEDKLWLNDISIRLWTEKKQSFIAHEKVSETFKTPIPNVLLTTTEHLRNIEILGFTPDVCFHELNTNNLLDFPRIIVVADQNPECLTLGRLKYRAYEQAGITPNLYKL